MASENNIRIHENRIVFLEKFMAEIVLGLYKEEIRKKKVQIAKLKQKLGLTKEGEMSVDDAFQRILKGPLNSLKVPTIVHSSV